MYQLKLVVRNYEHDVEEVGLELGDPAPVERIVPKPWALKERVHVLERRPHP